MPAYYRATFDEFLAQSDAEILGALAAAQGVEGHATAYTSQTTAWQEQLAALRSTCDWLRVNKPESGTWALLLEYPIPRRQKRIDTVVLSKQRIYCLEFKTGGQKLARSASNQVEDYALDLRDFHAVSLGREIVPAVVCRQFASDSNSSAGSSVAESDLVKAPVVCDYASLGQFLLKQESPPETIAEAINPQAWDHSAYKPVPTILEAAEVLFAEHDVRDIAEASADKQNLSLTSDFLLSVVERAQRVGEKVVCILTGVPGAGKTLAGLNLAHNPAIRAAGLPNAVFLSGNGPLVRVVSAALTASTLAPPDAKRKVGTFIQNVHTYIRDGLRVDAAPHENIAVFDEAQRAWDAAHVARRYSQLRQRGFDVLGAAFDSMSEPEMMLRVMDKHPRWAVLVALVGGGQEINDGEAGLEEWGRTLSTQFPHWRIAASPAVLPGGAGLSGHRLFHDVIPESSSVEAAAALHLAVSIRSYRAEALSAWVDAVLSGDSAAAALLAQQLAHYPLRLTRDLSAARKWLCQQCRGERRSGLLASAGALRLRAEGVELSPGFRGNKGQYENWFLNPDGDCRASNQLEVAASQFECQGLEIDWGGLCWGEDFLWQPDNCWCYSRLNGASRGRVPRENKQRYVRNAYRVLLTRAREGMVIFVPKGNDTDPTRPSHLFDATANFLVACGVRLLD
ncbi:MAG: DUF2075 domain-containing protein [Prosthecobacter sp.]|nr:DUF2075 domain-containing protein [Prosthecobacter sp.]HBJ85793.1 hypothetical protein [Verrucomicrobiales bacterium]